MCVERDGGCGKTEGIPGYRLSCPSAGEIHICHGDVVTSRQSCERAFGDPSTLTPMSMLHCLVRTPMTEPCSVSVETAGGSCVLLFGHRTSVLGSINMHVWPSTLCVWGVCVMLSVHYMSECSCVYPYGVPTNGGSHRGAMRSCSKVVLCALDENREHPMAVSTLLMSQNRTHTCGHMS